MSAAKKTAATKATATKPAAKKTAATAPATKAPARKAAKKAATPASLVVLPAEKKWTKTELDKVVQRLQADIDRLAPEIDEAEDELHEMMVDAGDGAGADQADVGSSSFERDQGLTIANNAREMLEQSQHALDRIADGSYGVCERCGEPIGKKRLMAFPRATLCMVCKQREERR